MGAAEKLGVECLDPPPTPAAAEEFTCRFLFTSSRNGSDEDEDLLCNGGDSVKSLIGVEGCNIDDGA
jgi:hypothetical protein